MANLLQFESSPYLLQHANNPVHWQAWNDAAWLAAKNQNKLVIVSVGYSACHWCHVMEHESFEDHEVAQLMNEHFICIKVDREERPDVDQIYMDACQILTGHGGWPLNAITLPDGRPVYAGTYFPKDRWIQVLRFFAQYWKEKPTEAVERAEQITRGIKSIDIPEPSNDNLTIPDRNNLFSKIDATWDYQYGGRSGAPKFPMPVLLEYLLVNYSYSGNTKALQAAEVTLQRMFEGGIYDHVGGGFARYSVDAYWEIPHFEKMLYDNAQLLSLYSQAYRVSKNDVYKTVVSETFDWLEREMSDPKGAFYSAIDADSEGEEGKFYVWSVSELKKLLGKDFESFCSIYQVSDDGNFEGANHLRLHSSEKLQNPNVASWKKNLLAERNKRVKPLLDTKSITSWNALTIIGCVDAYKAFGSEEYLKRAEHCAEHLKQNVVSEQFDIKRNYKDGIVSISGFLDDYALLCKAYFCLYEVTFQEKWLMLSRNIADNCIQHFYNVDTGLFFYTSIADAPLIARKTETGDNVIPSSNAIMCQVLMQMGYTIYNDDYILKSKKAVQRMMQMTGQHPAHYALWATLSEWMREEPWQVVITGPEAGKYRQAMQEIFAPNAIFSGAETTSEIESIAAKCVSEKTLVYFCRNKTCQSPISDLGEAINFLKQKQQSG